MPDRSIGVTLTLTLEDADSRSIRATAAEDFGVDGAAEMTLADVVCGIVRNTLEAQFVGFGVPVTVVEATASEIGV